MANSSNHRIVPGSEWGRTTPLGRSMSFPVSDLFVHHTVTSVTSDPFRDQRVIDDIGEQRFGIFSYSYTIHPDGTIMEGAGDHVGAHTSGRNSTSLSISLIGNYEERKPTAAQVDSFRWLRGDLVARGRLTALHAMRPHRAVKATACPGKHVIALWDELQKPHPTDPKPNEGNDNDMNLPTIIWMPDKGHACLLFPDGALLEGPTEDEQSAFVAVLDMGKEDRVANGIQVARYRSAWKKAHST